jgi:hypothetical protein
MKELKKSRHEYHTFVQNFAGLLSVRCSLSLPPKSAYMRPCFLTDIYQVQYASTYSTMPPDCLYFLFLHSDSQGQNLTPSPSDISSKKVGSTTPPPRVFSRAGFLDIWGVGGGGGFPILGRPNLPTHLRLALIFETCIYHNPSLVHRSILIEETS